MATATSGTTTITEEVVVGGLITFSELHGTKLAAKDKNGLSDPYLIITSAAPGTHSGKTKDKKIKKQEIFKTSVKKKTLNPNWHGESFQLFLTSKSSKNTPVFLQCWDWDRVGSDDFIGSVRLQDTYFDMRESFTTPKKIELDLIDDKGHSGGKIHLSYTFKKSDFNDAPPPPSSLTSSTRAKSAFAVEVSKKVQSTDVLSLYQHDFRLFPTRVICGTELQEQLIQHKNACLWNDGFHFVSVHGKDRLEHSGSTTSAPAAGVACYSITDPPSLLHQKIVWNYEAVIAHKREAEHAEQIAALALHPKTGEIVVSSSHENVYKILATKNGEVIRVIDSGIPNPHSKSKSDSDIWMPLIKDIVFTDDGKTFFGYSYSHTDVQIIDYQSGKMSNLKNISSKDGIQKIVLHPSHPNSHIICLCRDDQVCIIDWKNLEVKAEIKISSKEGWEDMAVSKNGKYIALTSTRKVCVYAFDAKADKITKEPLNQWDLIASPSLASSLTSSTSSTEKKSSSHHAKCITSTASMFFLHDDQLLVIGTSEKHLYMFQLKSNKRVLFLTSGPMQHGEEGISSSSGYQYMDLVPAGSLTQKKHESLMVSCDWNYVVQLDVLSPHGGCLNYISSVFDEGTLDDELVRIEFNSRDKGNLFATQSKNGTIRVYDILSGAPVGKAFHVKNGNAFLCFTPDSTITVCTEPRKEGDHYLMDVVVLDYNKGEKIREKKGVPGTDCYWIPTHSHLLFVHHVSRTVDKDHQKDKSATTSFARVLNWSDLETTNEFSKDNNWAFRSHHVFFDELTQTFKLNQGQSYRSIDPLGSKEKVKTADWVEGSPGRMIVQYDDDRGKMRLMGYLRYNNKEPNLNSLIVADESGNQHSEIALKRAFSLDEKREKVYNYSKGWASQFYLTCAGRKAVLVCDKNVELWNLDNGSLEMSTRLPTKEGGKAENPLIAVSPQDVIVVAGKKSGQVWVLAPIEEF